MSAVVVAVFGLSLFDKPVQAIYHYLYDAGDCIIMCYCNTGVPPGPTAISFGSGGACSSSCTARQAACY
jgi:hypothetical protein